MLDISVLLLASVFHFAKGKIKQLNLRILHLFGSLLPFMKILASKTLGLGDEICNVLPVCCWVYSWEEIFYEQGLYISKNYSLPTFA